MTQQKQRKQLILTDNKNIFTYCFQPIQCLQPNFKTDGIRTEKNFMAQQKQRKQLILTDDKNIFTYCFQHKNIRNFMAQQKQLILTDDKNIFAYCFQPIQRLQPNFKTDSTRNFMYTKHNGDNAKLRVFSFIPRQQRLQPNFMNRTYQTSKHTNTTRTTKRTTSTLVSPLTQSLCSYN